MKAWTGLELSYIEYYFSFQLTRIKKLKIIRKRYLIFYCKSICIRFRKNNDIKNVDMSRKNHDIMNLEIKYLFMIIATVGKAGNCGGRSGF